MSAKGVIRGAVIALVCGAWIAALAGCETYEGRQAKVARRADTSLTETRLELVRTDQEITQTLAAMDQLQSQPPDLRQAYRAFASEVSDTEKQASATREQAQNMRERWQKYIADWEQSIDSIRSQELRARASDRRQAVRDEYSQIRDTAREFEQAYEPFLQDLRDVERILRLDMTNEGVASAQPAFEAARQSGDTLRQRIDAFVAQLDQTIARRTTVNTSTQQATEY